MLLGLLASLISGSDDSMASIIAIGHCLSREQRLLQWQVTVSGASSPSHCSYFRSLLLPVGQRGS